MNILILYFFVIYLAIGSAQREIAKKEEKGLSEPQRDGKIFSLFSIVQFRNEACSSTSTISSGGSGSTNRNGTCFTEVECRERGGTSSGNCALGFGVCCVFVISESGGNVRQNCTYVRNPGFPNSYDETTAVTYTVNKACSNICTLRLDFEAFTILGPENSEEVDGGLCRDTFTISSNTLVDESIPTVCGQNAGQHMYIDIGNSDTDTAQLRFNFMGDSNVRMWEIKVSQFLCNSPYRPPDNCLQYHTGLSGTLRSFNFPATDETHLALQRYSVCIRQEPGFCCIKYDVCADEDSFSIWASKEKANVDTLCTLDYVVIEASSSRCGCNGAAGELFNKYCGKKLNSVVMAEENAPVCDCTPPFEVRVVTDNDVDAGDMGATKNAEKSRGVCLTWTQIPCC